MDGLKGEFRELRLGESQQSSQFLDIFTRRPDLGATRVALSPRPNGRQKIVSSAQKNSPRHATRQRDSRQNAR